jgi:putative ABC transport system permease protein
VMLLTDLLSISLRQIYRNKRRYKAALVGTAFGIAGLITVVTMGDSVESMLGKNLEVLGSATIVKCAWDFTSDRRWHQGEYTESDVAALRHLPGVLQVSPALWKRQVKVVYRRKNFIATVGGIEANFFETLHLPLYTGRRLTQEDVAARNQVAIIGQTVEKEFFGPNPHSLGKKIQIYDLSFEVVGVLGGAEDPSYMESVFVPISVVQSKFMDMNKIRDLYVRAIDWDTVPDLHLRVQQLLKNRQPGYADGMVITYFADRIEAIRTIVFIFKFFLYAAILVTLILGGLGITNVMLAVVNERTKEIGLRKAVGATERMIMAQFLCESLSVSLVGGAIGIACGFGSVEGLERLFETDTGLATFVYSVLASVGIAVILGVGSGLLPAARAGRLSAVDAMKFE